MSRLDELIQELCPDGVEFMPIKDVYQRLKTSLDKGTQRKTTENELPSLTQCTA